ncbi:hypothetical protein IFM89_000516 [Coptis chinensis]|uniref:Uncharacterized protein n=1 Tax=Coptis chinensis TaxID=261450 RepID=A0A835H0I7_9MAGN|nr:hypothetical protein IFM89_000516 [Coptis chinensis]
MGEDDIDEVIDLKGDVLVEVFGKDKNGRTHAIGSQILPAQVEHAAIGEYLIDKALASSASVSSNVEKELAEVKASLANLTNLLMKKEDQVGALILTFLVRKGGSRTASNKGKWIGAAWLEGTRQHPFPLCKVNIKILGNPKNGRQLVVKALSVESKQGVHEFFTDIDVITNVKHLKQGKNLILVYECVLNYSLDHALLGSKCNTINVDEYREPSGYHCSWPYGQCAFLKFARYTGAYPISGRFNHATFTNQMKTSFSTINV